MKNLSVHPTRTVLCASTAHHRFPFAKAAKLTS